MKKSNQPEMAKLLWVINFVNQDLAKMRMGDFLKLLAELKENLRDLPFLVMGSKKDYPKVKSTKEVIIIEDTPQNRGLISKAQGEIKNLFEKIYITSQGVKNDPPPYKHLINKDMAYSIQVAPGRLYVGPDMLFLGLPFEVATLLYNCSPPGEDRGHLLQLKKCTAPQKGGVCGKFFLQTHKKEKTYCSNKCAWRAYADYIRKDKAKTKGGK